MNLPPNRRFPPGTIDLRCGPGRLWLPLLALALLVWAPDLSHAQQRSPGSLERGDRVRVWSSEAGLEGKEFDFGEWSPDTLVLMVPDTVGVAHLSRMHVDRLQLRTDTGKRYGLEGALIGGGVGFVPSAIFAARVCGGPDIQGGAGCTVAWALLRYPHRGIVPGTLVGLLIGLNLPEYEWISVSLGPATGPAGVGVSPVPAISASVELRFP